MTYDEMLKEMRKVVASQCSYGLGLYDEMVKAYNPPPPPKPEKAEMVEKP